MAGGARGPECQSFGGTHRDPEPDGDWQPSDSNHKTHAPSPIGVVNPRRTTMLKQRLQLIRQRLTNRRPQNVVIVFADQWRGTSDVDQCHTPTLIEKAKGIFPNAICHNRRWLYPQHGIDFPQLALDGSPLQEMIGLACVQEQKLEGLKQRHLQPRSHTLQPGAGQAMGWPADRPLWSSHPIMAT